MICVRCKAEKAPEALKDELCFDCTRTLLWSALKTLNRIIVEPDVDRTISACEALTTLAPSLSGDTNYILQYSRFHRVKGLTVAADEQDTQVSCARCLRLTKLDSLQQGLCLRCTNDLFKLCLDDVRNLTRVCYELSNMSLRISSDKYFAEHLCKIPSK